MPTLGWWACGIWIIDTEVLSRCIGRGNHELEDKTSRIHYKSTITYYRSRSQRQFIFDYQRPHKEFVQDVWHHSFSTTDHSLYRTFSWTTMETIHSFCGMSVVCQSVCMRQCWLCVDAEHRSWKHLLWLRIWCHWTSYRYAAKVVTLFGLVLTSFLAQPSFITYFDLATRSDTTSLISCMNVCNIERLPVILLKHFISRLCSLLVLLYSFWQSFTSRINGVEEQPLQ